jgi:PAS domain S-box-containing protein
MPYEPPSRDTLKALETAPSMFLVLSPDLFILTASDLYLEATETKREHIAGKHIFEAFPDNPDLPVADGMQNINDSLQKVLRTKKPDHMRIQRYDVPDVKNPGEFIQRYWDPSHTPVLKEDGSIHYIIQVATNVTEKVLAEKAMKRQMAAEEKLKANIQHFKQLADVVPAKISNALPSGEVTFFNKQWLDYAGMNFEDLRDFGYLAMMHPDEIPVFQQQLGEAAAKGMALESELRFKDVNGNYRWHLNIASPILNEKGEITMWVGSTTDIQRIKEEEQRKTDFISMVSHELKTPLTTLLAYLQMLEEKVNSSDDRLSKMSVEQSLKQVRKMTTIINGFLNVSRLESGKMVIDKTVFNMQELLNQVEAETQLMTNPSAVVFHCPHPVPVFADRDKIGQVLNNLISNAIKYSSPGSNIQLICTSDENQVTVAVKDEGVGISAENIKHVFERYFRGHSNEYIAGFGIGLYLCEEIIKQHNGRIWGESEEGKGSTFYFTLPLSL